MPSASSPAQQFQQWATERWVTRSVTLAELGFTTPAVLDSGTNRREFYLPVPANVPLSDASLQLHAHYLRAEGGRTSMTLSIDGYPVAAQRFNEDQGDAGQTIGIDGLPRANGFVRFGIGWSSILSDQVCTDQRAPGNALRITSDSRFTYRYERAAINTLSTAWSALSLQPVLLVGGHGLSAQAYDTAWRIGVALERSGKHAVVRALPAVGDSIDLSALEVPAALRAVPAFAALGGRDRQHRIADLAQLGALIALGEHGPLRADLVVSDPSLLAAMQQALDALKGQIVTGAPDAAPAYAAWIASNFTMLSQPPANGQLRLSRLGGNPVIVIAADAVGNAAGLLGSVWQATAVTDAIGVQRAVSPKLDGDRISLILLSQFGALAGSIDVLSRAERSVTFDLGSVAVGGRLPVEIAFDLSAAPSINGEAPVASVFLNDYLLGARRLTADGRPQRISALIPPYALAARNEIKIVFFRQPTQVRCHDQPTAFPVSILPGSHIRLSKTTLGSDFVGAAGRFAGSANLLVPQAWLADPGSSLPQVIRIADAVGFTPDQAVMQVVKTGQPGKPDHAFLAFNVPLDGYRGGTAVTDGKLTLQETGKPLPMLALSGLDRLATVEVAKTGGQTGIVYRGVGDRAPTMIPSFRLTRGNLAVVGDRGLLVQIDTDDPTGSKLAEAGNPQSTWERYMSIWLVLIGVIIFVLLAARITHVRRRGKPSDTL